MDYSIETEYPNWVHEIYQKLLSVKQGIGRAAFVRAPDGTNRCIQISHEEWRRNTEDGRRFLIFVRGGAVREADSKKDSVTNHGKA